MKDKPDLKFYELWRNDVPYVATTAVLKTEFAERMGLCHAENAQGSTYWYIEKPKTKDAFASFAKQLKTHTGRDLIIRPFKLKYLEHFPGWKEPTEYYFKLQENEIARSIAIEQLIPKHHQHLTAATIGYYFLKKNVDDEAKQSCEVVAKAKKAPPHLRHFTGLDFMIFFYDGFWEIMTAYQRKAVVDHELQHCWIEKGTWEIRDHDLIEFEAIVDRYPDFNAGIAKLIAKNKDKPKEKERNNDG